MVKHTEVVPQLKVVAITCDRCKTKHTEITETQEFLSWADTCGYGNKTFGDLTRIEIDLCQYCVKEVLGDWIRLDPRPKHIEHNKPRGPGVIDLDAPYDW